jgi:hypothetical protein
MGWLYTRLVTANSSPDAREYPPDHDGSSGGHEMFELGTGKLNSIHHFMEMYSRIPCMRIRDSRF